MSALYTDFLPIYGRIIGSILQSQSPQNSHVHVKRRTESMFARHGTAVNGYYYAIDSSRVRIYTCDRRFVEVGVMPGDEEGADVHQLPLKSPSCRWRPVPCEKSVGNLPRAAVVSILYIPPDHYIPNLIFKHRSRCERAVLAG